MQMKSIGQDSGKIWNKTSTRLGDALAVSRFDEHGARAAVPLLWDRSVASERPSYVPKTALMSATSITSPASSCFWPPSTTASFTLIATLLSEAAMK
jgi:hypothetical protein